MLCLVDNRGDYYTRAWCCSEAKLMETLEKSYRRHQRWEHVVTNERYSRYAGGLDRAQKLRDLVPSEQLLSYEQDRPHVRFLERQSRLLGKG